MHLEGGADRGPLSWTGPRCSSRRPRNGPYRTVHRRSTISEKSQLPTTRLYVTRCRDFGPKRSERKDSRTNTQLESRNFDPNRSNLNDVTLQKSFKFSSVKIANAQGVYEDSTEDGPSPISYNSRGLSSNCTAVNNGSVSVSREAGPKTLAYTVVNRPDARRIETNRSQNSLWTTWLSLFLLIFSPAIVLAEPPCPQDENLIAPCHCSTRADEIQIWYEYFHRIKYNYTSIII